MAAWKWWALVMLLLLLLQQRTKMSKDMKIHILQQHPLQASSSSQQLSGHKDYNKLAQTLNRFKRVLKWWTKTVALKRNLSCSLHQEKNVFFKNKKVIIHNKNTICFWRNQKNQCQLAKGCFLGGKKCKSEHILRKKTHMWPCLDNELL